MALAQGLIGGMRGIKGGKRLEKNNGQQPSQAETDNEYDEKNKALPVFL